MESLSSLSSSSSWQVSTTKRKTGGPVVAACISYSSVVNCGMSSAGRLVGEMASA